MSRTAVLITVAILFVAGGAVLLAQNQSSVDTTAGEGTRIDAPGTRVESNESGTRVQAPGVDITVPKDKSE